MSKKQTKQAPHLTKAEEEVMQHIWALGRCTVADILEKLGKSAPPHSTISSIVRILERKGYVDHKAYGRTYEYFPIITKESMLSRRLNHLVSDYFGGSPDALVSFLVEEKNLRIEDLKVLLRQLEKGEMRK
jgi:BlaI family transcriptional regulator, penicillinase repressor